MTIRHCSCGHRLPEGKWFCGPDCRDLDAGELFDPPISEEREDTSYSPEENDYHSDSTMFGEQSRPYGWDS